MRKADTALLTRPKVTTPIGTFVAVLSTEIIHEPGLHQISKCNHANITNIDHYFKKVVVSRPVWEVMDMQNIGSGNCCSTQKLDFEQHDVMLDAVEPTACRNTVKLIIYFRYGSYTM